MSATITWEPADTRRSVLGVSAPSSFLSAMSRAFDSDPPFFLGKSDVEILRGMAAIESQVDNPYQKILTLIERHGSIRVFAEY